MKKILLASTAATMLATNAFAAGHEINIGVLMGFTGPTESLAPGWASGAELAISEVNASGALLGGKILVPLRADTTCVDASAATAAAEALVSTDNVAAIVGAVCSGSSIAVVNNVAVPNGVVMISPASTSPALSTIEDNGLFFRTAPSDARQGQVLVDVLIARGINSVAVSYVNNDYGKGLSDAFAAAFSAAGGTITVNSSHEDGKGDYSSEVGVLASAGGELLAVFGYIDGGAAGVMRTAADTGAFETFLLADGMFGDSIIETMGDDLNGSFGVVPGSEGAGADSFESVAKAAGVDPNYSFIRENYDAAALIALAIQAGGSADRASIAANVMAVANAPGEPIYAGELAKGLEILANGGEIDYVGGSNVELIGPGEAAGSYREYDIKNGEFVTAQYR